jgi:hypothetical protein
MSAIVGLVREHFPEREPEKKSPSKPQNRPSGKSSSHCTLEEFEESAKMSIEIVRKLKFD